MKKIPKQNKRIMKKKNLKASKFFEKLFLKNNVQKNRILFSKHVSYHIQTCSFSNK